MQKFETQIQFIKYRVLEEVARNIQNDTLIENMYKMPRAIVPGSEAKMRCCVHKERAILNERIQIALGGNREDPNIVEVIDLACEECPIGGHEVSNACRGCLAKNCSEVCPRDAIWFGKGKVAHIDKEKCIECGRCATACPFNAIRNEQRPCIRACKIDAISMRSEDKIATIDPDKCISCGACMVQCPFGAIQDKSWLPLALQLLKNRDQHPVYAIVAPSIATQFSYARLGQVVAGIKQLGFHTVREVALGADRVAWQEAKELEEKGDWLTSSCCPAFVDYVHKAFPNISDHVSHNYSPMAELGKVIKEQEPNAKVIFIGPCTAKKAEVQKESVKPYIDCALTFEELQALFGSHNIIIEELDDAELDEASFYGRSFAHSGGLTGAVARSLQEQGSCFDLKPISCDGIEECHTALKQAGRGKLDANFIEGMACVGGCIGGASALSHNLTMKTKNTMIKNAKTATTETIQHSMNTETT